MENTFSVAITYKDVLGWIDYDAAAKKYRLHLIVKPVKKPQRIFSRKSMRFVCRMQHFVILRQKRLIHWQV